MGAKILIADDSRDDRFLISRAIQKVRPSFAVFSVEDGEEAVRYISGAGGYNDRERFPFPDVLLLDLNMPVMGGFEVLRWLRRSASKRLPAVVHSSSALECDVKQAFELGADLYLCKAPDLGEVSGALVEFVERLPVTEERRFDCGRMRGTGARWTTR